MTKDNDIDRLIDLLDEAIQISTALRARMLEHLLRMTLLELVHWSTAQAAVKLH